MSASSSSSSSIKTCRVDARIVAVKYQLVTPSEFQISPAGFLKPKIKAFIESNDSPERLSSVLGDFFVWRLELGGLYSKTFIKEMTRKDTARKLAAECSASFNVGASSASVKAKYSNNNTSSHSAAFMQTEPSCSGGNPNVWLGLNENNLEEIQQKWASSINDDNLIPIHFKMNPIWELVKEVDPSKGEQMKQYLERKWAEQAVPNPTEYAEIAKPATKVIMKGPFEGRASAFNDGWDDGDYPAPDGWKITGADFKVIHDNFQAGSKKKLSWDKRNVHWEFATGTWGYYKVEVYVTIEQE